MVPFFVAYFTLRLEPSLAKKFDKVCRQKGYKKTGILNSLVREFIQKEEAAPSPPAPINMRASADFRGLVGIISLGGDAVEDSETAWFE